MEKQQQQQQQHTFRDIQHQVWATFVVNILVFGLGAGIGWYSPALPLLKQTPSPLLSGQPISDEQAGWIGASLPIGALTGNLGFGLAANVIGMKRTLLVATAPLILSWLMVYYAQVAWHVFVARMFAGFTSGAVFTCVPLFNAEIASDHVRGQLNSYLQVSCYSGMLFAYVLGSLLDYHTVPLVLLTIPILFFVAFVCLHDTPQQLLKIGQIAKAEASLRFYRNCRSTPDTSAEHELKFTQEFEKLKAIAKKNELQENVSLGDFLAPEIRNTILIGSVLMSMAHLCGTYILCNYAATIFAHSGSTIDASLSAIIMGSMLVVGVYSASMLIDRYGRRILMLVSSGGAAVGLAATGCYAYLSFAGYNVQHLNCVPVVALSFFIFVSAIGMLPVPYVYVAEIFPQRLRRIGCTLCTSTISMCAIVQLKTFPLMLARLELHGCMLLYTTIAVLGLVFTLATMSETKGKNLDVLDEREGPAEEAAKRKAEELDGGGVGAPWVAEKSAVTRL